jgi:hypothetical protein
MPNDFSSEVPQKEEERVFVNVARARGRENPCVDLPSPIAKTAGTRSRLNTSSGLERPVQPFRREATHRYDAPG